MNINAREATWMMFILLVAKIFFSDINRFVFELGTAGYLQALICTAVSLCILVLIIFMFKKTGMTEDVFYMAKYSFGTPGLLFFGMILLVVQIFNISAMFRVYALSISTLTLSESPVQYIMLFIAVVMISSGYAGIGGMSKFCGIIGVLIAIFLALLFVLDIPHCDVTNIFPILGNGAPKLLIGLRGIAVFNETMFLFMLIPYLKNRSDYGKVGIWAMASSGLTFAVACMLYVMTVPYPAALNFNPPMLQLSSSINIDFLFQRAESIYLLMWVLSSFLYIGVTFCFFLISFKKTFSISDQKAVIPVFALLIGEITDFWSSVNEVRPFYTMLDYVFMTAAISMLILIAAVAILKTGRRKNA